MSVKLRLIIMNFLQYFIWGCWLISLGIYVTRPEADGGLAFNAVQVGSIFATMGIASLFMPGLLGIIADKWIPAQKLLGICHLISGALLVVASTQVGYGSFYILMLLSVMFYMPTIALSNSVAYSALEKAGLDTVSSFPPIRVWGTVGFIVAMWIVDFSGFKYNESQLVLAAAVSLVLGIYSFSLPKCNLAEDSSEKKTLAQRLGLDAFVLFKNKQMAVFFLFAMLLGAALQITNMHGGPFLESFASNPLYADSFGVKHSVVLLSISQISETLFILTIPFFLRRFGIKNVMLMSMAAWVLRFGLFGTGNPGDGLWMLILSMIVYGMAFDFFNISGSLFVEQNTKPSMRSSAQGLFMIMTNGVGTIIGSYGAGKVVAVLTTNGATDWSTAWYIFAGYALIVMILFAFMFKYEHKPEAHTQRVRHT